MTYCYYIYPFYCLTCIFMSMHVRVVWCVCKLLLRCQNFWSRKYALFLPDVVISTKWLEQTNIHVYRSNFYLFLVIDFHCPYLEVLISTVYQKKLKEKWTSTLNPNNPSIDVRGEQWGDFLDLKSHIMKEFESGIMLSYYCSWSIWENSFNFVT